jgi:drug/metabolite transporter (DMT)-like permease
MEHIGPFLFNGIRFALGALVLVGLQKVRGSMKAGKRGSGEGEIDGTLTAAREPGTANRELPIAYGLLLGLILFAGASFQQVGIVYTTAGNAGFITGLSVILVPIFGFYTGQKASWNLWIGALLAAAGLYFLSLTSEFKIAPGDLLVLVSAIFWAIHVLYTGWLSPRTSSIRLAITQNVVCSILSFLTAFIFEKISLKGIYLAAWPVLYGGILSVGIAYTLQIVAQKKAPPTHASIIMSLESVFALIGGIIVLSETMNERKWIGCGLMLMGMVMAVAHFKIYINPLAKSGKNA